MADKVQKIIAEIKDRISNYQEYIDSGYDDEEVIKQEELKDLLSFIDSMPKRQVYILKGEIKDAPIADTGDCEVFLDYCRDEYDNILDKICDYVNEKYSNDIDRYKVTVQITIDKED